MKRQVLVCLLKVAEADKKGNEVEVAGSEYRKQKKEAVSKLFDTASLKNKSSYITGQV